jgi:phosphate transport system permease protein
MTSVPSYTPSTSELLADEAAFKRSLRNRHLRGTLWKRFFQLSLVVAFAALIALFFNVVNAALGYVVEDYAVNPTLLAVDGQLETLSSAELVTYLVEYRENRLPVFIRDYLYPGDPALFTSTPLGQALPGATLPEGTADLTVRDVTTEQMAQILESNATQSTLVALVKEQVVQPVFLATYSMTESLFGYDAIYENWEANYKDLGAILKWYSWVNLDFLTSPASSNPAVAGINVALLGTIWVVFATICIAFPIGVGAAIYLQEYTDLKPGSFGARLSNIIETNIRNLAGVPSIIYGLLGLAVFVRLLVDITGGRTIWSASLTMALLILPVIIINAQEALRAVPSSLREASYGMGATKLQTIRKVVLPSALPGVLTGTILAMSRAVGETAPLIIIGASTFILTAPTGMQSKFTVLPITIYNWTSRPQQEFRDAAAAAIIVLLVILLLLNATAIILRQRARRRLTA